LFFPILSHQRQKDKTGISSQVIPQLFTVLIPQVNHRLSYVETSSLVGLFFLQYDNEERCPDTLFARTTRQVGGRRADQYFVVCSGVIDHMNQGGFGMEYQLGKNIHSLRRKRQVSQEDLARAMGVTTQAVSKWENGKANPDLFLLPKLAEYFGVTIDSLFLVKEEENMVQEEANLQLEQNLNGWTGVSEKKWKGGIVLPSYGHYTPTEETLCLLGDVRGKTVLELGCGSGESLAWMREKGAKELWVLDISAAQIKQAQELLGKDAKLFVSPMEFNPGLPFGYFDLIYSVYGVGWSVDLNKTFTRTAEYLKPGGRLIFSWDNPLMQCIDSQDGKYVLNRSYIQEREIRLHYMGNEFCMCHRKLSTYLNCLSEHGFFLERVVEESAYDEEEANVFQEGRVYSAGRARLINSSFIVKARKMQ